MQKYLHKQRNPAGVGDTAFDFHAAAVNCKQIGVTCTWQARAESFGWWTGVAGPATLTHSGDRFRKNCAQGCTDSELAKLRLSSDSSELIHQVWFSKGVFMTILRSRGERCSPSLDVLKI